MRKNDEGQGVHQESRSDDHRGRTFGLLALFSASLLAVWLLPGNASEAQNRAPIDFPVMSPTSVSEAETYRSVDAAIRDRIGAQVGVAELVGQVSAGLLQRSPSTRVVIALDGQPFFADDFTRPCRESEESLRAVESQLQSDASSFKEAGKYLLYVVAPDKSSTRHDVVDQLSPDLLRCSDFVRAHFEIWATEGTVPVVTLWQQVAAIDATPEAAYMFNDTHWNATGSVAMTSAVFKRLVEDGQAPAGILDDLENPVEGPTEDFVADLNGMMGVAERDERSQLTFVRKGVRTTTAVSVGPEGTPRYHSESTSDSAPLVPGRTLFLGDSFTFTQLVTQLPNFFEDVTIADHYDSADAGDYDRVVVERVQRDSTTDGWPVLAGTLER